MPTYIRGRIIQASVSCEKRGHKAIRRSVLTISKDNEHTCSHLLYSMSSIVLTVLRQDSKIDEWMDGRTRRQILLRTTAMLKFPYTSP